METRSIVYISAEVVVGVLSVLGNAIVLAAILRTRKLHTVTNVFVGNLAAADIAVGLLVAPCAALSYKGLPKDFYGCVMVNSAILLLTNVSILMLLAVALERFLAIKEPYVYQRLMTVRRAVLINVAVWLLGTLLGLVPMYGWNYGKRSFERCDFTKVISYEYMVYFQFFGLVLVPLFLMLCIYAYILIIVRRHMKQTSALHRQFLHNHSDSYRSRREAIVDASGTNTNSSSSGSSGSRVKENAKFNKDVRAAKMFALVILLFGLFWLPVNIFNCVSLFCGASCKFPIDALLVAIVMSHANSSINPFLYAATNSRIKLAIKRLFCLNGGQDDSDTDGNLGGYRSSNGNVTAHQENSAVRQNGEINDSSNIAVAVVRDNFTAKQNDTPAGVTSTSQAERHHDSLDPVIPCSLPLPNGDLTETQHASPILPATKESAPLDEHKCAGTITENSHRRLFVTLADGNQMLHSSTDACSSYEDIEPVAETFYTASNGDDPREEMTCELQILNRNSDVLTSSYRHTNSDVGIENKALFRRTFSPPQLFPLLSVPYPQPDTSACWLNQPLGFHQTENEDGYNSDFLSAEKQTSRRNSLPTDPSLQNCDNSVRSFQNLRKTHGNIRTPSPERGSKSRHFQNHVNPAFIDDVDTTENDASVRREIFINGSHDKNVSDNANVHNYQSSMNYFDDRPSPDEFLVHPLHTIDPITSPDNTKLCWEQTKQEGTFKKSLNAKINVVPVKTVQFFDITPRPRNLTPSPELERNSAPRGKQIEYTKL